MLILAATAVRFAIFEHHREATQKSTSLSVNNDAAPGAYESLVEVLDGILEESEQAYHTLMANLLKSVCRSSPSGTLTVDANHTIQTIDFNA